MPFNYIYCIELIFNLNQSLFTRFKKFKIESYGRGTIIAGKRLLKKTAIRHAKECCFTDHLSSTRLSRKVSTKDTPTSVECSVQAYISLNILRRAISMFTVLEVELVVLRIRIVVVILVTGGFNFAHIYTLLFNISCFKMKFLLSICIIERL